MDRQGKEDRTEKPVNPFAPPQVAVTSAKEVSDVPPVVRRDRDLMLVGSGAEFLPICFITGEPASTTVKVDTVWQPPWVYLTMLPGLVPYLFVSPWFVQNISLRIPIGPKVLVRQKRRRIVGCVIAALGLLTCWLAILLGNGSLFALSIAASCLGTGVVLRRPVRLSVAYADRDLLILRNVHSACLDPLPSLTN